MYIEASSPREEGDTAQLETLWLTYEPHCLSFFVSHVWEKYWKSYSEYKCTAKKGALGTVRATILCGSRVILSI